MILALLAACAGDPLPGEVVLGVDVPAAFTFGAPRSRLGADVAWSAGRWAASAPGASEVWIDGVATDVSATRVGWWGERVVTVTSGGTVTVDGEIAAESADRPRAAAIGPRGVLLATDEGIVAIDGSIGIAVAGVEALAWGEERVLAVVCAEACEGHAWSAAGEDLGPFAEAGADGAVGEWEGTAWVGDPASEVPDGAGLVRSEAGDVVEGAPGDHLGGAIGGGYAAGTFNKWVVPARARIVPLLGGDVLALEEGAENQPIALAGGIGSVVIGAPYHPAHGQPSGAVVVAR